MGKSEVVEKKRFKDEREIHKKGKRREREVEKSNKQRMTISLN